MRVPQSVKSSRFLPTAFFFVLALGVVCFLSCHGLRQEGALYTTKSDNLATVWLLRTLSQEGGGATDTVNFPFRRTVRADPLDFATTLPAAWLASITSEILAFNLVLALASMLSGAFTYALIYALTKRSLPSAIGGLAYMVLPFYIAMSQHYFTLARVEVFPLFLLALVWFLKHPRWHTAGWILLAQFVSFSVNPHYGLFNLLILLGFLAVFLFYRGEHGWARPTVARAGGLSALAGLAAATGIPRFLSVAQEAGEFALGEPFEQLHVYSARVWDYFVPPAHHPLLGRFTRGFIEANIHDSFVHVQTLYLGITVVMLATLGAWWLWRSRDPEHRFLGVFLPVMAVGAFLFSMPPTVELFGLQLPMPGLLLYQILPMFRVYARFGVVVAMATIVLAGFGMAWVLERVRFKKTVTALLGGLILLEFLPTPQYVDLSRPPAVYEWLAEQDDVVAIAEYPLHWPPEKVGDHLNLWDLYEYMLWQRVHRKPMFNGEPEKHLDMALKLQLGNLADPNVPARLGWLGVTHIGVHKDKTPSEALYTLRETGAVEDVYTDGQATVFRITGHTAWLGPDSFRYSSGVSVVRAEEGVVAFLQTAEPSSSKELMIYGPYLAMYTGTYRVTFGIQGPGGGLTPVRLVVAADGGRKILAQREVEHLGDNPVLEFRTEGDADVEFRVYAGGGFEFQGVEIVQLSRGSEGP